MRRKQAKVNAFSDRELHARYIIEQCDGDIEMAREQWDDAFDQAAAYWREDEDEPVGANK